MSEKKGKGWHIGLWVLQAVLAIAFGMAGAMKLGSPIEELASNMATLVPVNVVLGGLAALIVWGRAKKAPIQPRS